MRTGSGFAEHGDTSDRGASTTSKGGAMLMQETYDSATAATAIAAPDARDIEAERVTIDLAINGKTLCSELARTVELHGDLETLRWQAGGERHALTWSEYRERLRDVSLGLGALGFERGGFGLVLTGNRPEHVIACQGIVHALGTPVGLYDALAPAQVSYIANHCEATVAVVEAELLHVFLQIRAELPNLRHVVVCGAKSELEPSDWVIGWDELLAVGRAEHERDPLAFEAAALDVTPDDLATVIYTSGTTGPPKGVMLTHRFALCWVESWSQRTRAVPGDRIVSYMPLAHCTSQWLTQWQSTVCATATHFCTDPSQLVSTLREVRPTWFLGPPRVWEKLRAAITAGRGDGSSSGLDAIGLDRCRVPGPTEPRRAVWRRTVCLRRRLGTRNRHEGWQEGARPLRAARPHVAQGRRRADEG